MPVLRLALAQTNPRVGDLVSNAEKIRHAMGRAREQDAHLVAFPEMSLTGYPIEDLALRRDFLERAHDSLTQLAADIAADGNGDTVAIIGLPTGPVSPTLRTTHPHAMAHNSAAVVQNGRVLGYYHKQHLPNYSVFDEYRNFVPGTRATAIRLLDTDIALIICEDMWQENGPLDALDALKPGLILVINGSPFERDKTDVRHKLAHAHANAMDAPLAYVNLVGGQDDLVFDGQSFVMLPSGTISDRAVAFDEDLVITDINVASHVSRADHHLETDVNVIVTDPVPSISGSSVDRIEPASMSEVEEIWRALTLGLRDYVNKNNFPSVILGLSGGIDSAVCASLAVDALGPERVVGVSMPSKYSSDHSQTDAADLAHRLSIRFQTEPIANLVSPLETQLGLDSVAAENLQARIRGVILMGLANQEGHLTLTTGNKSELAVGYSTIYGDSVGGFAPLKDVPKTLVWELARWRNSRAVALGETPPIPENSISKPPSAELRPDQTDQDSLPPYEVLDDILERYISDHASFGDIVGAGHDAATVSRIIGLVNRAEWKRRQGAIGPKISGMAFGRDRRLPITAFFG